MNIQHYNVNNPFQQQPFAQTPNNRLPFTSATPNGTSVSLDALQLQNPMLQQRLQDATQRQQSPLSNSYNVSSIVPAKRPRPGNDEAGNNGLGTTGSPRPMANFSTSRSQTPQSNFPTSFPPHLQHQSSNPYQQHLQQNSSNGMSPNMSPQAQAHAQAQAWAQAQAKQLQQQSTQSPQTANHGLPSQFPPNLRQGLPNMQNSPQTHEQVRDAAQRYRQHQEMQQRTLNLNSNKPNFNNGRPAMSPAAARPNGSPYNAMSASQQQAMQLTQQAQMQKARANELSFTNALNDFLAKHGRTPEPNPTVCTRPISYYRLFATITQTGILQPGPNQNNWAVVANALGFLPPHTQQAAEEARALFQRNLQTFVIEWSNIMQKRKAKMAEQQRPQSQSQSSIAGTPTSAFPSTMSPAGSAQPFPQRQHQTPVPGPMFPPDMKPSAASSTQGTPLMRQMSPPQALGPFGGAQTPTLEHGPNREMSGPPTSVSGRPSSVMGATMLEQPQMPKAPGSITRQDSSMKIVSAGLQAPQDNEIYKPRKRVCPMPALDVYHGGIQVDTLANLGIAVAKAKPGVPPYEEMGIVDIHALTMSIRSGIHAEIRYALDDLVSLSHDERVTFALGECEGLLEALIECGEDQMEILNAGYEAPLDQIDFPNFERLTKASWKENFCLTDCAKFASSEYELERAADRLIAITTVLSNLSIPDSLQNHDMLTRDTFVGFVASTLRSIGLRPSLLRTSRNLVDLMKDIVTLLSNIAHRLEIPSREDAASLLHFLLAFTPLSSPTLDTSTGQLSFYPYDPRRNQYLPSAIDAFAKLFARDEPNRSYFRAILASDSTESPATCLLTRAFALAIAPIPNRQSPLVVAERNDLVRIAQERNPFLTQGMLAGDILATLLQGADDGLAREWLRSEDGWAPSLLQLVISLGFERSTNAAQLRHNGRAMEFEAGGCNLVAQRGLSMLKRLVEKVDRSDKETLTDLFGLSPERGLVVRALTSGMFEAGSLKNLVLFAALDG